MHKKAEQALHQDFHRWTALVDRAAHAENEVERENPALAAAELQEKWTRTAPEGWRTLHSQWCDRIDPTRPADAGIRSASGQIADANCACALSRPLRTRAISHR
ncbi:hypothetical protein ACIHAX_31260 [Nocardia sp. NPDC051929]|uniref:hypothetical protein n=1 Tax=unclassified Nocardia TaxID=2637762 RepID=UPI0034416FFB